MSGIPPRHGSLGHKQLLNAGQLGAGGGEETGGERPWEGSRIVPGVADKGPDAATGGNVGTLGGKEEDHPSPTDLMTLRVQCRGPRVRNQKKRL